MSQQSEAQRKQAREAAARRAGSSGPGKQVKGTAGDQPSKVMSMEDWLAEKKKREEATAAPSAEEAPSEQDKLGDLIKEKRGTVGDKEAEDEEEKAKKKGKKKGTDF